MCTCQGEFSIYNDGFSQWRSASDLDFSRFMQEIRIYSRWGTVYSLIFKAECKRMIFYKFWMTWTGWEDTKRVRIGTESQASNWPDRRGPANRFWSKWYLIIRIPRSIRTFLFSITEIPQTLFTCPFFNLQLFL